MVENWKLSNLESLTLSADIQLVSELGRRHLRSSSYRTLAVPRTRTTLGDRNFAVAQDRVCGTVYRLLYDRSPATDSLGNSGKHIYSEPRNRSALWLLIIVHYTKIQIQNGRLVKWLVKLSFYLL